MRIRTSRVMAAALLVVLAGAAPPPAPAAEMDGSVSILCSVRGVMECDRWGLCEPVEPPRAGLPPFIRVEVGKRLLLAADGSTRQAPIQTVAQTAARLILQGEENGRAWTMVIGKQSSEMTGTMVDDDGAFVVSGACTPY
jgi:hypothetical protein